MRKMVVIRKYFLCSNTEEKSSFLQIRYDPKKRFTTDEIQVMSPSHYLADMHLAAGEHLFSLSGPYVVHIWVFSVQS